MLEKRSQQKIVLITIHNLEKQAPLIKKGVSRKVPYQYHKAKSKGAVMQETGRGRGFKAPCQIVSTENAPVNSTRTCHAVGCR